MHLIGDIGGTKSRFSLVKGNKFCKISVYFNKEFKNFYQVLNTYLKERSLSAFERAVFACAGPVFKEKVFLPNIGWEIKLSDLKKKLKKFKVKKILLVNDLFALSFSFFSSVFRKYLYFLEKSKPVKKEPALFIAPGTGLGVSAVVNRDCKIVLPTEAGHSFIPVFTQEEKDFTEFLKQKGLEVSLEKFFSGNALSYWYEFYTGESLSGEKICERALKGEKHALKTIEKIISLFGRICAHFAFIFLPYGGIYLAGGLSHGLFPFFKEKKFRNLFFENFYVNPDYKEIFKHFPIALYLHPEPVFLGALSILRNL